MMLVSIYGLSCFFLPELTPPTPVPVPVPTLAAEQTNKKQKTEHTRKKMKE